MKICPFCAEEIQEAAIKCRHCGEFIDGSTRQSSASNKLKWYFRTSFIVIAICSVGPLALPLLWWRPGTKRSMKIVLTLVILVLSWLLYRLTMQSIHNLSEYYKLLEGM